MGLARHVDCWFRVHRPCPCCPSQSVAFNACADRYRCDACGRSWDGIEEAMGRL